jgi:hypothetical protein
VQIYYIFKKIPKYAVKFIFAYTLNLLYIAVN